MILARAVSLTIISVMRFWLPTAMVYLSTGSSVQSLYMPNLTPGRSRACISRSARSLSCSRAYQRQNVMLRAEWIVLT